MAHLEPRFSVVPGVIIGWVLKVRGFAAADRVGTSNISECLLSGLRLLSRRPGSMSCVLEPDRVSCNSQRLMVSCVKSEVQSQVHEGRQIATKLRIGVAFTLA